MQIERIFSVAAIAALAVGLSACGGSSDDVDVPAATAAATEGADSDEAEAVETTAVPEVEDATDSSEADGTRKSPYPAGSTLTVEGSDGTVEIVVGEITWDANQVIAETNQFNEPAPEGSTYVLIPVTYTNVDIEDGLTPWIDLSAKYVSPQGNTLDEVSVVSPEDVMEIAEMFDGASASGNLVFLMTEEQKGGVISFEHSFSFSGEPVYVATS
nr:hypothetical protein [Actinomycetales bacterium]